MGNIQIISNNPQTQAQYPAHIRIVEGGVYEVYRTARSAIHQGAILINHPLAGSVKPNQNPYRSLVLSIPADRATVDFDSLSHIEGALQTLARLPKLNRQYDQSTLEDFQLIDHSLLEAAINALPPQYHT
ncbi:MAG: GrdX family protein [Oscillospiraceae bacterium]|nr:GrdX family protein [Oscillospiraceae bacterium]